MAIKLLPSAAESRLNDQIGRLLSQKKGPDAAMIGVLSIALLLGLVGFALHVLWVVSVIVMALGLGFAVANSRRDRIDASNQLADEQLPPAPARTVRRVAATRR
ncbi:MAG: hypothetical protein ACYCO3_02735 [Mycobacteriales bacterium]